MSAPDLNDLQTQSLALYHLLAVLYEEAQDLQFTRPNGEEDTSATRVATLLILARDEAERLDAAIEQCLVAGKTGAS